MEELPKGESRNIKFLKLLLKIAVTLVCLWYVSKKIDFSKAGQALQNAKVIYLFLALIAFIISKWISAIRLQLYFANIGIHLKPLQNLKLYWLGMFYNLFLPGAISGDAYKVVLLSKNYKLTYKKTTSAVLLDRFSGLLGLGLLLAVYGTIVLKDKWLILLLLAGAIAAVLVLYLLVKKLFRVFVPSFFSTLFLGIAVQACQVVSVYFIMASLHIPVHTTEYIFIFLVSSVVAVLPLTIGGLGAREIVFLEGSRYFDLIQENSVLISIIFYLITVFTSAFGVLYVFRDPLKKIKDKN